MVKLSIGEGYSKRMTHGKAAEVIRLLKQVDNVFIDGKIYRYSDSGLELSSNGIYSDSVVIALEEM